MGNLTEEQMLKPEPYVRGKTLSVIKNVEVGKVNRVINLSQNESCYGTPQSVFDAIEERVKTIERYADVNCNGMREAIGKVYDIDPDLIICGNGSEELLDAIGRIYARSGDEILYPEYSFLQFPIVAYRVGATPVSVANKENFALDVDGVLDAVTEKTKVLYVANPNNPTGVYTPRSEINRLVEELPKHVVLVLDAAYAEYCDADDYTDGMEYVGRNSNVVVTRTLSKAYGLAGIRAGWAYTNAEIAAAMNNMRGIGNVNALAQAASIAAIKEQDFIKDVRQKNKLERNRCNQALMALGIKVIETETNFLLLYLPDVKGHSSGAALKFLALRGVMTRTNEDYGLDDYLRISLGKIEDNNFVLELMTEFMST